MIKQRCVLGDGADASEQRFVGCHRSAKVTAGELERLLHETFSSFGLNPYVDRCSAVPVSGGFFVEIILHDASRVWLAEEIVREQVSALEQRGISLTFVVRTHWVVNHVRFAGVCRSPSGEFINLLRFKGELQSGQERTDVEVRVDARALDRWLKHPGIGTDHRKAPTNSKKQPTITKVIEELLATELSLGGADYWDPSHFPRRELGETAMNHFFAKNGAATPKRTNDR
jgi:hypothetical protein